MRKSYLPKIWKKLKLFTLFFTLIAFMSHVPPAESSQQVCYREELGLWTRKTPISLESRIRILMDTSNWPNFVLYFQGNNKDKFRLIFRRAADGIQIKGIGVTPSIGKFPHSAIQQNRESVLSFGRYQNGILMSINSGAKVFETELPGIDFDLVDSVQIQSNIGLQSKTIISFCNMDDFTNSSQGSGPLNNFRSVSDFFDTLLEDDIRNRIIYGLAGSSILFLITSIALGIALCKTKTHKHQQGNEDSPQLECKTQHSLIALENAVGPDDQHCSSQDSDRLNFQMNSNQDTNTSLNNYDAENFDEGNNSDWSDQEPVYENLKHMN